MAAPAQAPHNAGPSPPFTVRLIVKHLWPGARNTISERQRTKIVRCYSQLLQYHFDHQAGQEHVELQWELDLHVPALGQSQWQREYVQHHVPCSPIAIQTAVMAQHACYAQSAEVRYALPPGAHQVAVAVIFTDAQGSRYN